MSTKKKDSDICSRCGKLVDEHEAGRETDACFAEVVMGHTLEPNDSWLTKDIGPYIETYTHETGGEARHVVMRYSTRIERARLGLLKILQPQEQQTFNRAILGELGLLCSDGHPKDLSGLHAYLISVLMLPPDAIVRACLKAKLAEKERGA